MSTITEFARTLAEEAEKRGLRIVIEPITNPVQKSMSEPIKEPEIEVVTKTATQIEKERVREEKSCSQQKALVDNEMVDGRHFRVIEM